MTDQESTDQFLAFSREYSEALEALEAIEKKAEMITALGGGEDLRTFVDRFVEMARGAQRRARDAGLGEIASWFGELIDRAGGIRESLGV